MCEDEDSLQLGPLARWMGQMREITNRIRIAQSEDELQKVWDQFWVLNAEEFDFGSASTSFLVPCLLKRGALTVLCVGNGPSLEAPALAHAGFTVDVLDISAEANRMLLEASPSPERLDRILGGTRGREGGRMVVHTGDFRKPALCPGPYDAVISRGVLQYFADENVPVALQALHARLAQRGLLVLESMNARHTRKPLTQHLRDRGFAVAWDIETRGKEFSAPRVLSSIGPKPAAWVLSSTG